MSNLGATVFFLCLLAVLWPVAILLLVSLSWGHLPHSGRGWLWFMALGPPGYLLLMVAGEGLGKVLIDKVVDRLPSPWLRVLVGVPASLLVLTIFGALVWLFERLIGS